MTTLQYALISAVVALGTIALSHAVLSAILYTINGGF